jgi:hypothetical protein
VTTSRSAFELSTALKPGLVPSLSRNHDNRILLEFESASAAEQIVKQRRQMDIRRVLNTFFTQSLGLRRIRHRQQEVSAFYQCIKTDDSIIDLDHRIMLWQRERLFI